MMRCKEMMSLLALAAPFVTLALWLPMSSSPVRAGSQLADLCVVGGIDLPGQDNGGACEYSSTDVPALKTSVCWDGTNTRLEPVGAGCMASELELWATYGEVVDPLTNEIQAYAPLPSSCYFVPCAPSDVNSQQLVDGVACCNPITDECVPPDANGNCPVGNITWCKEVEDNGDGTVTCHE